MAGRIRSRLDLRRQAEAAELRGPVTPPTGPDTTRGSAARKASGRKGPVRVCARWGVFDGAMKLVASFDFNQKPLAEQKAAELNDKRAGTYFVQMFKEPMAGGPNDDED